MPHQISTGDQVRVKGTALVYVVLESTDLQMLDGIGQWCKVRSPLGLITSYPAIALSVLSVDNTTGDLYD